MPQSKPQKTTRQNSMSCLSIVSIMPDNWRLDLVARLVNGLTGTSVRALAIKTWVETFSPYNSATDDTGAVRFTMPKNADKRRPWMMEDAKSTPFWELTIEKEVKAIDVIKMLESIAKRVETGKEKGVEILPVDADAMKAAMLKVISAV
jgi:hypothetical protein